MGRDRGPRGPKLVCRLVVFKSDLWVPAHPSPRKKSRFQRERCVGAGALGRDRGPRVPELVCRLGIGGSGSPYPREEVPLSAGEVCRGRGFG